MGLTQEVYYEGNPLNQLIIIMGMENERSWERLRLPKREGYTREEFFKYFDEVKKSSPERLEEFGLRNNWQINIWEDHKSFVEFLRSQEWLREKPSGNPNPDHLERNFYDLEDLLWIYIHEQPYYEGAITTTLHPHGRDGADEERLEVFRKAVNMFGEYLADRNVKAMVSNQAHHKDGHFRDIMLETPGNEE